MSSLTRELPIGVVTLLFTDVEGSTQLLRELGAERYAAELIEHRACVRAIVAAHDGVELGTEGDAFFLVFEHPRTALSAAAEIQSALADGLIRLRMGIHSGEVLIADGDYFGLDVHKAARICSAAHGGQVLVSRQAQELAGVSLRNVGSHRLKDLGAPEQLFQLDEAEHPPPRTLYRANLPVQPSPLVGRGAELTDLIEHCATHRLVTLTGPGGTGKTRLALALAAELSDDHEDGVWWIPLASLVDHTLLRATIARVLDVSGELATYLADRQLLLVLDNLEQIVAAAGEIAQLLELAPRLRIVATSRERLGVAAEQEYPVPPLSDGDARHLFTTRARQVDPGFEPGADVATICARLDRLPLALELAATRVNMLSEAQILARLDQRLKLLTGGRRDLPHRQATMRAAIDWSYDLLDTREQLVFRALAIFAGSFELEAAESVCDAELDELQSLADKSLVRRRSDGRFFLLETTHEYARERLHAEAELAELERRHARWFLQLAIGAQVGLRGSTQLASLRRIRADEDNFRAALAWTSRNDPVEATKLAAALFLPWRMSGQLDELIHRCEQLLEGSVAIPPGDRATALITYGDALMYMNRTAEAHATLTEALELFRRLGDEHGEASALDSLGGTRSSAGSIDDAIDLHSQALAIYERIGDATARSRSLHLLAENLRDAGALDRAAEMLEQAVAIDAEHGNAHSKMTSLHSLGDLALDQRNPDAAATWYHEALAICTEQDDDRSQAYCLAGLACVAKLNADPESAARLWAQAQEIEIRIGMRMLTKERQRYERILAAPARGER